MRQLVAGDNTSDVLAEFLELLDGLDLGVKAVYLDRGFYNLTFDTQLSQSIDFLPDQFFSLFVWHPF